jgi:hypothetical protein
MTDPLPRSKRRRWLCAIAIVVAVGLVAWTVDLRYATDMAAREAWRLKVGQLGVAVYAARPVTLPFLSAFPRFRNLLMRRQVVAQVLSEQEAGALLLAPPAPSELTIMKANLSEETVHRIRERFPAATLVDYPNMPP